MTPAILHLIRTLDPAAGGPVEFLKLICEAHTRMGARVAVVTLDDPAQEWKWPVSVFRCGPGAGSYGYHAGLIAKLRQIVKSFDLIICHGLWEYGSLVAARVARQRSIPYYVFTHGMLDPWFKRAFPFKHLKKQLYWLLLERGILQRARSVIFTSEGESRLAAKTFWPRANYRKLIVPLGVRPAEGDREELRGRFLDRYPHLKGRRFLLFLARLHPKKGCDLLLEAFSRLRPALDLVLAGPKSSTEYLEELQKMAIGLPVTFTGMLTGPIKSGALVAADALILPSHQENFGMVVAEALSFGLPVLVSSQVNISDVVALYGAGFVEPDTLSGTCALIERWLAADGDSMRKAAEHCYRDRFEIERSARELLKIWSDGGVGRSSV
jgi:glycosyltransferase involved in cell wall biosynthesis